LGKTAYSLLVGVILHVLYAECGKSLARVAHILSDPAWSFEIALNEMMATNHLGSEEAPMIHPVVAEVGRELLNKSPNEGSSVLSTAMSFVALYRDPTIALVTGACDWCIADLMQGKQPVSLYLVVPPSDISRTKPLIRLILNQIEKAYGANNAILDNCHVRVAFAANDERTVKRISDSLGTATEQKAQRNYAGNRLAVWLGHVMESRQETPYTAFYFGKIVHGSTGIKVSSHLSSETGRTIALNIFQFCPYKTDLPHEKRTLLSHF
jgi:type IV secretion system protein VirD4